MTRYVDRILDTENASTAGLTPHQLHLLRLEGRGLEADAEELVRALVDIRTGQWDGLDTTVLPHDVPVGAPQRQLMEHVLYAADHLIPRAEALRAWALHGLRTHHGRSHEEIAQILGTSRGTAQSRWRAVERKRPDMWDWARGLADDESVCDGLSIGVMLEDGEGRVLVIERARAPWGMACPSGHGTGHHRPGDEMDQFRAIGTAEVHEETGLEVAEAALELVSDDWRGYRCGRHVPEGIRPGHRWIIFHARIWSGTLTLAPDEARTAEWCSPDRLQELVERTIDHAYGHLSIQEFRARPGAEPAWVRPWRDAGYIRISAADLAAVEALAATPPAVTEES